MKTQTIDAIILGHKNFGEKDKLVFLYTKEFGKIKTVAKGSRSITSRFTGHLETLNFCKTSLYFGPKNTIITEIETKKTYLKKRTCLETLTNALKIAELTNKILYENQTLDNLSDLLKNSLKALTKTNKKNLIYTTYVIKILDQSGNIPDFKNLKSKLDEKYLKFFNYIKEKTFDEIEKIKLTKTEIKTINKITQKLINFST